jgi:hypothetical protein
MGCLEVLIRRVGEKRYWEEINRILEATLNSLKPNEKGLEILNNLFIAVLHAVKRVECHVQKIIRRMAFELRESYLKIIPDISQDMHIQLKLLFVYLIFILKRSILFF